MASRHSTGVTYSLARNSCLNMSMWLECAICGRGAEFPRSSARRCLTFPHGVYSAHRFSSQSFSSPTRCTGFADSPPVDYVLPKLSIIMGNCRHPPQFHFHGQCDPISHCTGTNSRFRWTLQYFCILQGQLLSSSPSDRQACLPLFTQGGVRRNSRISLNSEMKFFFFHNRANYFHPGANAVRSHGSRDS